VILDCDPGTDDAIAIGVLAGRPDAQLGGIVAVGGNAGIDATTRNALRLATFFGVDVPVGRGSAAALTGPFPPGAEDVHGTDGLGGCAHLLPDPVRDAPGSIELLRGDIVATGPLTDVALAIRLGQPITSVVWMGGSIAVGGNVTAAAEFNAWSDAAAADVVLTSGLPVAMVPLDVTRAVIITDAARDQLTNGNASMRLCAALVNARAADPALHDPVAVIAALEPELFDWEQRDVRCEWQSELTRGVTVVDRRGGATGPIRVAVGVDGPAVVDRIVAAIGAGGERGDQDPR
jgi:inosine-uridine nucleoside N-ribohydrolase